MVSISIWCFDRSLGFIHLWWHAECGVCLSTAPRTQKKFTRLYVCIEHNKNDYGSWVHCLNGKSNIQNEHYHAVKYYAVFSTISIHIWKDNENKYPTMSNRMGKKPFLTKYKWINTKRETFGRCTWYLHLFQFFSFTLWNDGTGMKETEKIRKNFTSLLDSIWHWTIHKMAKTNIRICEPSIHPSI